MIKKKIRKELEAILNDLRINLENNYKDLAHDALNRLHATLDEYYKSALIKEKDYNKYKKIADDYTQKMMYYHH